MTFHKNNKYCWQPEGEKALDRKPLCFKLDAELKEQLKTIPDWQKKLRDAIPELMVQWLAEAGNSDAGVPEEGASLSPTNFPQ